MCSFMFTYIQLCYSFYNTNTVDTRECSLGLCNKGLAKFTPEIVIFAYPVVGQTGSCKPQPEQKTVLFS